MEDGSVFKADQDKAPAARKSDSTGVERGNGDNAANNGNVASSPSGLTGGSDLDPEGTGTSAKKETVGKKKHFSHKTPENEDDLIGSDEENTWLAEDRLHLSIESNAASPSKAKGGEESTGRTRRLRIQMYNNNSILVRSVCVACICCLKPFVASRFVAFYCCVWNFAT